MWRCSEDPCYFLLAEDQRQSLLAARKGNVLEQKSTLPSLGIEEAQGANDLVIAGSSQLLYFLHVRYRTTKRRGVHLHLPLGTHLIDDIKLTFGSRIA
jgi:hypothetical protein